MRSPIQGPPLTVYLVRIGARRGKRKTQYPYKLKWQEVNGKWRQRTVRTHNRRDAEKARDWLQAELSQWAPQAGEPTTFDAFKEIYLADAKARLAPASKKMAEWALKRFGDYMAPGLLAEIDVRAANKYMLRRTRDDKVSPATVQKEYRLLHAAFSWAVENGYMEANPFSKAKPPKGAVREKTVLNADQCQLLLTEAAERGAVLHAFVSLALETGMRIGEMANLESGDIDFSSGLIRIRPKQDWSPKARRGRVVAVSQETIALLQELRSQPGYLLAGTSRGGFKCLMREELSEACKDAKIPKVTPHDLRRTAGTLMAEAGVPQDVIQTVLGHQSYQTTRQFYVRIRAEDAARRAIQLHRLSR